MTKPLEWMERLPNRTVVEPFDNERYAGLNVSWVEAGTGFGEVTIAGDKETGCWTVDTEEMSVDWCGKMFMRLREPADSAPQARPEVETVTEILTPAKPVKESAGHFDEGEYHAGCNCVIEGPGQAVACAKHGKLISGVCGCDCHGTQPPAPSAVERPMDHCGFSTGIGGEITAGRGRLDDNGYWELPCEDCAKRANYRAAQDRQAVRSWLEQRIAALEAHAMALIQGQWLTDLQRWDLDNTRARLEHLQTERDQLAPEAE